MSSDATWSGVVHMTGSLTVDAGVTLTIDPGTVVKLDPSVTLTMNGDLVAVGTELAPIYFTSITDDTVGGDTNLDGDTTTPAPGQWRQISIATGGSAQLEHVEIRYGGSSGTALRCTADLFSADHLTVRDTGRTAVEFSGLADGPYSLNNVAIRRAGSQPTHHGLYINSSNAVVNAQNLTVEDAGGIHVIVRDVGKWSSAGTALAGTGISAINFQGGNVTSDSTWADTAVYYISGGVAIDAGATLDLPAGSVLKFAGGGMLTMNGNLNVVGEALAPVVFTSMRDDSVGGDNNGDGDATGPAKGDWRGLQVNTSGGATILNAIIRYAGSNAPALRVSGDVLDMEGVTIEEVARSALEISSLQDGPFAIRDVTIRNVGSTTGHHGVLINNTNAEVTTERLAVENVGGTHVIVRNAGGWTSSETALTGSGLRVINFQSGTITDERSWDDAPIYYLTGNVTINQGAELLLPPGTIMKSELAGGFTANGRLTADGIPGQPVVLTSFRDDTVGGDTNADGDASVPAPGDWDRIAMGNGGVIELKNVEIAYGGRSGQELIRTNSAGTLTLLDSMLSFGTSHGVFVQDGNATLLRNHFSDLVGYGVNINSGADSVVMTDNIFLRAQQGCYAFDPAARVTALRNTATECGRANAVRVSDSNVTVDQSWQEDLTYFLDSGAKVVGGVTLTIVPGSVLKMDENTEFGVEGTLVASGTESNPTVFTSVLDDSVGGDTNQDGAATTPSPGNWQGLVAANFSVPASVDCDYCEVRFAGASSKPAVEVGATRRFMFRNGLIRDVAGTGILVTRTHGPIDFTDTVIRRTGSYGARITSTGDEHVIVFRGMAIDTTGNEGLRLQVRSSFDIEGVTMANVPRDGAILIASGGDAMDGVHNWAGGYTYFMETDIAITNQGTMNIGPGAVLKFNPYDGIQVDGTLNAMGTAAEPVIFTTIKDDTGGDTNEDGSATTPIPGDWFSIWIRDTAFTANANLARVNLDHVEVRYAGGETPTVATPSLLNDGGIHYLKNVLIRDCFDIGLRSRVSADTSIEAENLTIRGTVAEALAFGTSRGNGAESSGNSGGGHSILRNVVLEDIGGDAIVISPSAASYEIDGITTSTINGLDGTRVLRADIRKDVTLGYLGLVVVEHSLQVESGGSLTVLPGTTMKMRKVDPIYGQTVLSARNGPIHAVGKPEEPILFTSLRDDAAGGDTNNDQQDSEPAPGDWVGVWLAYQSQLEYAEIRYAGGDINGGALSFGNYDMTVRNVEIHQVGQVAVTMGTGYQTLQNCLIHDYQDTGVRYTPSFSSPPESGFALVNNTIVGGRVGFEIASGAVDGSRLINNNIAGASDAGVAYYLFLTELDLEYRNNNLYNPDAIDGDFYDQYGTVNFIGDTGNMMVDPLFVPDAYELGPGSPLIDAASGSDATDTDLRGYPRFDDPAVTDIGTGSPPFADIGALERLGSSDPTQNPDLIVVAGSVRSTTLLPFAVGQSVEVEWETLNQGQLGTFQHQYDAVYISDNQEWDVDDPQIAQFRKLPAGVGGGEAYTGTVTGRIPPVAVGEYFLVVRTDHLNLLAESLDSNNVGISSRSYAVDVPELPVAPDTRETLTADDNVRLYRFEVEEPLAKDLLVDVQTDFRSDSVEVLIRRNAVPTRDDNGARDTSYPGGSGTAAVQVPLNQPGTYYVLVKVEDPFIKPDNLFLSVSLLDFGITKVTPGLAGNAGKVTVLLEGAQFASSATVELEGPTRATVMPVTTLVRDSSNIAATFDLAGADVGFYSVRVRNPAETAAVDDAVEIVESAPLPSSAGPELGIFAWESLRYAPPGRIPIGVTVRNPYLQDLPVLLVFNAQLNSGEFAGMFSLPGRPGDVKSQFVLVPLSDSGRPGILAPGETATLELFYHGAGTTPTPGGTLTHIIGYITQDGTSVTFADSENTSFLHSESRRRMGETWAEAGEALREEAVRLLNLGYEEVDAERLWTSIIERVSGVGTNLISGVLLDEQTGSPMPGEIVVAVSVDGTGRGYETTTDDQGRFDFFELINDAYRLSAPEFPVTDPPEITVVGGMFEDGVQIYAGSTALPEAVSEIRAASPANLLVEGVPHSIFFYNGILHHTYLDGASWTTPSPIPGAAGTHHCAIYSSSLLEGAAAIAVFFQQTGGEAPLTAESYEELQVSPNDVRIMYAVARSDGQGGWEWSEAAVYADHSDAAYFAPTACVTPQGNPLVVFQALDMVNPEDDADLYYCDWPLSSDDLVFPERRRSLLVRLDDDFSLGGGQVLESGTVLSLEEDGTIGQVVPEYGNGDLSPIIRDNPECDQWSVETKIQFNTEQRSRLPDWFPFFGGNNDFEAAGFINIVGNLGGAAGQGGVEVKIFLFEEDGFAKVEATATFLGEATWTLDREKCEYVLSQFKLSGAIAILGRFPIPAWSSPPGSPIEYEVGVVVGINPLGGELVWDTTTTTGWPKGKLVGGLTGGFYGTVNVYDLAQAAVQGTANAVVKHDAKGFGMEDLNLKLEAEAKVGFISRKITYIWPSKKDLGLRGSRIVTRGDQVVRTIQTPAGFDLTETIELVGKTGTGNVYDDDLIKPVLSNLALDFTDDTGPEVITEPGGVPRLFWTREAMSFDDPVGNRILHSAFDGSSWSIPQEIPGVVGFNRELRPIALADGELLLAYVHAEAVGVDHTDVGLYLAASEATDVWFMREAAGTWSTPLPVAISPGMAAKLRVTALPNSEIWAAWVEGNGTSPGLYATRYDPSGAGWTPALKVTEGSIGSAPAIALRDGSPELVWAQGVDTDTATPDVLEETRVFSSTFSGGSWSSPVAFGDSPVRATGSAEMTERGAQRSAYTGAVLALSGFVIPPECCNDDENPPPAPPVPPFIPDPRWPGAAASEFAGGIAGAIATSMLAASNDPNDKLGPAGFGVEGYVRNDETFVYVVQYENDPEKGATAPALKVEITDVLSDELDLDTFTFNQFGWDDIVVELTTPVQSFTRKVNTANADGSPLIVEVTGRLDRDMRTVSIVFQSIDPDTGLPPLGTFDGFLQVEQGEGDGQGFFTFTVMPNSGRPTGTQIRNMADIIFDTNEIIPTPETFHTLDAEAPTSAMNGLEVEVLGPTFDVSWSGDDGAGSGISWYDIYVAENGGPFAHWISTADTSAEFTGVIGNSYEFYAVATDNVGRKESKLPLSEASTVVVDMIVVQTQLAAVPGWNALSLPGEPLDPSVSAVLGDGERAQANAGSVWTWDPTSGTAGRHRTTTEMHAIDGHWVYFPQGTTLTVEGSLQPNQIPMATGWNFTGPTKVCSPPYDDGRIVQPVQGWDARARSWKPVPADGILKPGNAYLFYATEPFTLDLKPYETD